LASSGRRSKNVTKEGGLTEKGPFRRFIENERLEKKYHYLLTAERGGECKEVVLVDSGVRAFGG